MKAITLTQPWATLVAIGEKQWETRSWRTNYRGRLAIHAAKGFPRSAQYIAKETQPFQDALNRPNEDLPLGAIIAVVTLEDILPVVSVSAQISGTELVFGDYTPGRWAWQLTEIYPLQYPVPCKGALSLWDVPSEVVERIVKEIAEETDQ